VVTIDYTEDIIVRFVLQHILFRDSNQNFA